MVTGQTYLLTVITELLVVDKFLITVICYREVMVPTIWDVLINTCLNLWLIYELCLTVVRSDPGLYTSHCLNCSLRI